MALRVKAAVQPPELGKVSFNLPVETIQLLKVYGKAYQQVYHHAPDEDYLVNAILTDYLNSDKEFQRFLDNHPEVAEELSKKPVRRGRKPKEKSAGGGGEP